MKFKSLSLYLTILSASLFALTGCPQLQQALEPSADLTLLLAADDSGSSAKSSVIPKARVVQLDELESLTVTVDEIALERVTDTGTEEVVILSTPFDLNLLDILNMRDLIDSAAVPEGVYTGAILSLSNAMAVFSSDPATIVPVDLLDGGTLRVPTEFEAVENGEGLLVFDLGGITLVELDAGGFQLVPDLQVGLFASVQAQARGEIKKVDRDEETIVIEKRRARILVDVSQAVIFLPEDFDTPTGAIEDLAEDMDVLVIGTLNFDGSIAATTM